MALDYPLEFLRGALLHNRMGHWRLGIDMVLVQSFSFGGRSSFLPAYSH